MPKVIQFKRGLKTNIPTLSESELGYTNDSGSEQLYIGTGSGNILLGRVLSGASLPSFSATLYPIGALFLVTGAGADQYDLFVSNGVAWIKVGVDELSELTGSLDDIADGSTYGRVLLTQLTSGKVNQIDDGSNNVTASQARSHIDDTTTNPHNVGMSDLSDFSANNNKITNLATPTLDTDAVNKAYVDANSAGLDPKESVRLATTADLGAIYATTPSNGQFTSAPTTIDGIAIAQGDRILVKDQTDQTENGIYVVEATTSTWTRSDDMDGSPSSEVSGGNFTFVEQGTQNENAGFVLQGDGILILNTNNLTWVQFSGAGSIVAGDGLTKTGSTLNVVAGNGIIANADDVAVDFEDTNGNIVDVDPDSSGTPIAGVSNKLARADHKHVLPDIDCGTF